MIRTGPVTGANIGHIEMTKQELLNAVAEYNPVQTLAIALSVYDKHGFVRSGEGYNVYDSEGNYTHTVEDTKTQVISIFIINLIAVALSYLILNTVENEYVTICLGLAFSISYIIGIVITIKLIKKHVGKIHFSQFMGQHSKLILASVIAMSPMFVVSRFFDWHGPLALLLVMLVSTIGYFLVAKLLRVAEISMITGLLRSSRGKLSNKE